MGARYKHPTLSIKERGQWHSRFKRHETKIHEGEYGPDICTNHATEFMEEHRDTSFFIYYPMNLPHSPFQPTPDSPEYDSWDPSKTPYKDNKGRLDDTAYFQDMVEYIDMIVGRFVNKVHELGISENTLIIFTTDNGTDTRIVSSYKGRKIQGDKGHTTKYGTKVPLIAYWNGVIESDQVNDNLIDFTDFLPTFMDVANAELPEDFHTDGISFYKQLLNEETEVRDWIFCSYDPNWGEFESKKYVHNKKWKLYGDGAFYNIEKDPEESNPLLDSALTPTARIVKKHFSK
ncbi:MAG: sulfatase-like hydrolase/transferase, partial [Bacteroidota bacterium]